MTEFLATGVGAPLFDALKSRCKGAARLDVASAFFTEPDSLRSVLGTGWVGARVVVRLDYPTHPDGLRSLRDDPEVEVRCFGPENNPTFHEKVVIARGASGVILGAYVGSANWTAGGLRRNTEAGLWLEDAQLLERVAAHFEDTFRRANPIRDSDLERLERHWRWHRSVQLPPERDPGVLRRLWRALPSPWLIKQHGVKEKPFVEGEGAFRDYDRYHAAQTVGRLTAAFSVGRPVVLCFIAQRRSTGRRDRLIYGRGVIADVDPRRWRLPRAYLDQLGASGHGNLVAFFERWPEIVLSDPIEFVDYPKDAPDYVWLGDLAGFSHMRQGHRNLSDDDAARINSALDDALERYGRVPVNREGIWWNSFTGAELGSELYMTVSRIERMMADEVRA